MGYSVGANRYFDYFDAANYYCMYCYNAYMFVFTRMHDNTNGAITFACISTWFPS